ncbi:hypothetical protein G9A89_021699 [Geosiphon pyriformis]|nr:hypothetical protein G9A89_021699 [Geosiphon pyriformis]
MSTQKLLEDPLLPQNKTSNFNKAFDAEGRFSPGVDFYLISPPSSNSSAAKVNLFPHAVENSTIATTSGTTYVRNMTELRRMTLKKHLLLS